MKNKLRIIIFLIITAVMMLTACDALIAPMKERLNPNDSYNPVPAAADFSAGISVDPDGIRLVVLTWQEGLTEVQGSIEGYVIIRSIDSPPQSIWDGELVTLWATDQELRFEDRVGDDPDYFFGKTIYYSIFSYGPKWQDMNEEEKIGTNENNVLFNTQNYNFTGPVSASQDVWDVVDLPVAVDKFMNNANIWYDTNDYLDVQVSTDTPDTIAGIIFELSNAPEFTNVKLAQLILTKYVTSPSGDGLMQIARWDDNGWISETSFALLTAPASNVIYDEFDVTVPGGGDDELQINVDDIYSQWMDGATNAGFSLRSYDATNVFTFISSEGGAGGPKLRVYFMH